MRMREIIDIIEEGFDRSQTFYHVTLTDNLPSILDKGLTPTVGDRSEKLGEHACVFLFPDQTSAEDAVAGWLGEEFDEDQALALIEVVLPVEFQVYKSNVDWEIFTRDAIPAKYLKVISRDF